ncbi:MAG: hypothetical protein MUP82_06175 [Candidatus Marinimicrobia bacterium]|nr:hypothetical protein [Candidatus Neomarinimicrobiota bacterium]
MKRLTTTLSNTKCLLTSCPRRHYKVDTPPPAINKANISKDRHILLIISKSSGYLGTGDLKTQEETAINDSLGQGQTQYLVLTSRLSVESYIKKNNVHTKYEETDRWPEPYM